MHFVEDAEHIGSWDIAEGVRLVEPMTRLLWIGRHVPADGVDLGQGHGGLGIAVHDVGVVGVEALLVEADVEAFGSLLQPDYGLGGVTRRALAQQVHLAFHVGGFRHAHLVVGGLVERERLGIVARPVGRYGVAHRRIAPRDFGAAGGVGVVGHRTAPLAYRLRPILLVVIAAVIEGFQGDPRTV